MNRMKKQIKTYIIVMICLGLSISIIAASENKLQSIGFALLGIATGIIIAKIEIWLKK